MKKEPWFEKLTEKEYKKYSPYFEKPEALLSEYADLLLELRLGLCNYNIDGSVEIMNVLTKPRNS